MVFEKWWKTMVNKIKQRLCGGTFFTLFLRARKPLLGANKYYDGKLEPYSEPIALFELSKVVVPDWQNIFVYAKSTCGGNTSEYKNCKNEGGILFPFSDATALTSFDRRVKEQYSSALHEMCVVTELLIDTGSAERDKMLVEELLTLIEIDDSIDVAQPFYVLKHGGSVTKSELRGLNDICLQSFLLGVWHYAVTRPEKNTFGKETIDFWCPSTGGGKREYNGGLHELFDRKITISYYKATESTVEEETGADDSERDTVIVDTENCSGEEAQKEPAASSTTQQVLNTNPTFNTFNFNASIHTFNNQVGTVVNNYGGKKDEQ